MNRRIGLPELTLFMMCVGASTITTPPPPVVHQGVVSAETEIEANLESYIGKEILAPWGTDIKKYIDSEARILEISGVDAIRAVIDSARGGWDHFNKQYNGVTAIVIDYTIPLMDARLRDNSIGMNPRPICAGIGIKNEDFGYAFVHELAHVWHKGLAARDLFDERWREISGSDYSTSCPPWDPEFNFCSYNDAVEQERELAHQAVASLSWYGATSILEDVAEYAAFAFIARNYSPSEQCKIFEEKGFKVPKGQEQRVEKKIDVAVDFWFFSEREGELAKKAVHHYVTKCPP